MEIIVEIHRGEDGRPTGTVRSASEAEGRPFSGNLEFLALVEDLYLAEPTPARSFRTTKQDHMATPTGECND
jgi:hypothetical protein